MMRALDRALWLMLKAAADECDANGKTERWYALKEDIESIKRLRQTIMQDQP